MPNVFSSAARPRCARRSTSVLLAAAAQFIARTGRVIRSILADCPPKISGWSPIEFLENRRLLSVSLDSAGWTVVTPAAGDHVIYVSSSGGNDANSGLSPSAPIKTLEKGVSLMRNGTGDELLLKAGDVWHDDFVYWRLSGRSAQDPMVIGSYGSGARPTIMSGISDGLTTGASSSPEVDYLDIIGLHFWADGRDPSRTSTPAGSAYATGINILSKSNTLLVENCLVQDYAVNLNFQNFQGPLTNISVRRNVSIDSYSTNNHSQGLYSTGVTNLLIEGNLFDHNGYNDSVPGAQATWYNHDCYLSGDNTGCVVQDNIFSRASGYGLQARSGGIVQNNVFLNDPVGMSYGLVNGASGHPGGVTGSVTGNIFVGGANIGNVQGGSGLQLANISTAGVTVSNNIFTHSIASAPAAITLTYGLGQSNASQMVGLNNVLVQDNTIYGWSRGVQVDGGMTSGGTGLTAINNVTFSGNDFKTISDISVAHDQAIYPAEHWSNNYFDNAAAPRIAGVTQAPFPNTALNFADPSRTVDTYDATIGGAASATAFLNYARAQSHQSWNARLDALAVIAYIRAGLQLSGSSAAPAPVSDTALANASISGTYFYDSNHNGVWDSGESISPQWYVYIDANNNGVQDPGERYVRADTSGHYTFSGLAAGTYVIRSAKASGWVQTSPTNGGAQIITVAAGQNATGANFGVYQASATPKTASISGTFFYDSNANGVWNSGEPISPLWYLYIDANNDGQYDTGDTLIRADNNGAYVFGNLNAGTYVIRAATASGWKQTSPANGAAWTLSVSAGQSLTGINFGEVYTG